jgi:Ca-activated chloride channel family protein
MSTTSETSRSALLSTTIGKAVLLQRVDINASVDGLLFTVKARQFYKNTTDKNIETIYTFPLAWGATLLGLTATMAGKVWQGTVLPKSEAEESYEKAIKDGDTPIMVEQSGKGLYTAHMGNLKPDEEAIIEIEYAQLLRVEQGQVRLSIPTTVAPRYGDPVKTGKLKKPASVDASLAVSYPLSLDLVINGPLAKGAVACPSHQVSVRSDEGKTLVNLNRDGYLDRDLVLVFDGVESAGVFAVAEDGGEYPALLSFTAEASAEVRQQATEIELKILVDCSGSMEGDSIKLARKGLKSLLPLLSSVDKVSYSLFGTHTQRVIGRMTAATPEFKARSLTPAITKTKADLGGTELQAALKNTFEIVANASERPVNVLLITDGEVWDIENTIQSARESNHRIFAIGVGSSPAESLLREIAEHSDGACELVSPNEDMAAAMQRMVTRMRQGVVAGVSVDWHAPVVWHAPIPKVIYPGETIHLAAVLGSRPAQAPVLSAGSSQVSLGAVVDMAAGSVALGAAGASPTDLAQSTSHVSPSALAELAKGSAALGASSASPSALTRMVGAKRVRDAATTEAASQLAVKYQLVTEHTNLFMVINRAADDKALGLPALHQIAQMVAAGWHGMGSVRPSRASAGRVLYSMSRSSMLVSAASYSRIQETPRYMRRADEPEMLGMEPMALLSVLEDVSLSCTDFEDAMTRFLNCDLPSEIDDVIQSVADALVDRVLAWAVFLEWLIKALNQYKVAPRQVKRLLDHTLSGVMDDVKDDIQRDLSKRLPGVTQGGWGTLASGDDELDFEALIARQSI